MALAGARTSVAWQDVRTLAPVREIVGAHDRIANGCAGLEAGRFASIGRDLKLRVWEADFTATTIETPHSHSIKCVAAGSGGRLVATGTYDGHVALYDLRAAIWSHLSRPVASGISSLAYDPVPRSF